MPEFLLPGDPAPHFRAAALSGMPNYTFDTAAGRPIVMLFLGSGEWPVSVAALRALSEHRNVFDDIRASFFGVSVDPRDVSQARIAQSLPGIRWFLDHDRAVSQLYGALKEKAGGIHYRPHWLLLDSRLCVVEQAPVAEAAAIFAALDRLIAEERAPRFAPVLVAPRILDAATCRDLIAMHRAAGGEDSGFMREENGVTVRRIDHTFKRRSDCMIPEGPLRERVRARFLRFLSPQIVQAFQFKPTRVERWLVACYDDRNGGGFFRSHRDNTTKATAHRKFACTINLNAEEYEGGDLCFPEYGSQTYRAPTGGAVIFSCALLHTALPVTRGERYALLPFFYDDAGARLRESNLGFVEEDLKQYRSGLAPEPASAESG